MKRTILMSSLLFLALALSGCGYNDLTAAQQKVKSSWSNVESQLQRRGDLIANLAEAAKMAGVQEQEVFGKIAEARSALLNAQNAAPTGADGDKTPEQKEAVIAANNSLGATLGRLLLLQENYPDLKSNANFLKLQDELAGTENRIATSRQDYTTAAEKYNTMRNTFPTVITASIFGFKEEPYFKADEASKAVPKLNANELRNNPAPANANAK